MWTEMTNNLSVNCLELWLQKAIRFTVSRIQQSLDVSKACKNCKFDQFFGHKTLEAILCAILKLWIPKVWNLLVDSEPKRIWDLRNDAQVLHDKQFDRCVWYWSKLQIKSVHIFHWTLCKLYHTMELIQFGPNLISTWKLLRLKRSIASRTTSRSWDLQVCLDDSRILNLPVESKFSLFDFKGCCIDKIFVKIKERKWVSSSNS